MTSNNETATRQDPEQEDGTPAADLIVARITAMCAQLDALRAETAEHRDQ